MKRKALKLYLSLASVSSLAISCSKQFTCTCELYGVQEEHPFNDLKQKEAEEACTNLSDWYKEEGGNCELSEIENP